MNKFLGNFLGAYSDTAVLIPLVFVLSTIPGYDLRVLLASAGIFYLVSGFLFKIPLSVQPLKSIVATAIIVGATQLEIRLSGALLGVTCLFLYFFPQISIWSNRIPRILIHGVQLGLGVLLLIKGLELFSIHYELLSPFGALMVMTVTLVIFGSPLSGFPILGLIATAGLFWAIFGPLFGEATRVISAAPIGEISMGTPSIRWTTLLALLLPQIVLTSTNSIIATEDVAKRYYGDKANRVSIRNLLASIGLGNILSSFVSGLPFCHGSGGMTAHYKGGSNHWASNWIIGGTLILMALVSHWSEGPTLHYPLFLLSPLLASIGIFHMLLALPSWKSPSLRPQLVLMGMVALLSRNLLLVLLTGIFCQIFLGFLERNPYSQGAIKK